MLSAKYEAAARSIEQPIIDVIVDAGKGLSPDECMFLILHGAHGLLCEIVRILVKSGTPPTDARNFVAGQLALKLKSGDEEYGQ